MARTPQELVDAKRSHAKIVVEHLEKLIDESMDKKYVGGIFKYELDKPLEPHVLDELQRRYQAWDVSPIVNITHDVCGVPGASKYCLQFRPKTPRPNVSIPHPMGASWERADR